MALSSSPRESISFFMESSSWLDGWKRAGWRKADKQPVMNADLWQELDKQLQKHRVKAQWVRGHAGHPENERVDKLASEAAKKAAAQD